MYIPFISYKLKVSTCSKDQNDIFTLITFYSMYLAIFFKIQKIQELSKNKKMHIANKILSVVSMISTFYLNKDKK